MKKAYLRNYIITIINHNYTPKLAKKSSPEGAAAVFDDVTAPVAVPDPLDPAEPAEAILFILFILVVR